MLGGLAFVQKHKAGENRCNCRSKCAHGSCHIFGNSVPG